MTIPTIPAAEPAPDVADPMLASFLASLPPDPVLDRLTDGLNAAWSALQAERRRGNDLRRRRAALAGALPDAVGGDRTAVLTELLAVERDLATLPAGLGAATERYVAARLAYRGRLVDLAEAEARRLVEATNEPIGAVGRAKLALERSQGHLGDPPAGLEKTAGLRAEAERLAAAVRPDVERHRAATEAAAMVRAIVVMAFGEHVARFDHADRPHTSWEAVARRAAEAASESARRAVAVPVGRAA